MNSLPAQDSSHAIDELAALYKACGDSLRLEILRALKSDSFGVLELCEIFEIKQSAMSHHLKILSTQGLVQTRREGNSIFYQRAVQLDQHAQQVLVRELFDQIDRTQLHQQSLKNIVELKQQRANLGKIFFSKNVEKFREQQELIAQFDQYQKDTLDILLAANPNKNSVLELGPGDGRFLTNLSNHFDNVIALDYANEMLNQAREYSLANRLNNIEFVLGECRDAIEKNIQCDCLVMNMVLHHLPSPADCFKECAQLLNDDGVLVISDLCQHEQAWAKEACGDLWLGFNEQELTLWAAEANLELHQSSFRALRNGFQILFCTFKKLR